MKILKGKVAIGQYKGIQVQVDWTYLAREKGLRKEQDQFQIVLGNLLFIVSLLSVLFIFVYQLSLGNFVFFDIFFASEFVDFLFVLFLFLFVYANYLKRDREDFVDTLDLKALNELRKVMEIGASPASIEVLDYVDPDFLNILDDLLISADENIYPLLMRDLIRLKDVKVLISRMGLDYVEFQKACKNYIVPLEGDKSFHINKLLFQSFVLAEKYNFSFIGEWVVFLHLALGPYVELFKDLGVQEDLIRSVLEWTRSQAISNRYKKMWKYRSSLKPVSTVNRSYTSAYTGTLNKYSRDLTSIRASEGFVYALSREAEIGEIIRNLRQQTRVAVLLVGEPGIGKTTILKSIASRMVVEDVPKELKDKRLVEFDFEKAIASSKNTNDLRKTIESIMDEVEKSKNVILVIDDLDQLVNIRNEISEEIVSSFVDALENNNVKLIATTTKIGLRRSIAIHPVLKDIFDVVEISEPTPSLALQILFDERAKIESKYGISIQFTALKAAVDLTIRYDTSRLLPLKAIEVLEDACVLALEDGLNFVSGREVERIISKDTGIKVGNVSKDDSTLLMNLEKVMHKRVVGQEQAIEAVADSIRRAKAGLSDSKRPIASFLFFGPTGVGKTEVAKTLATVYFGDEKLFTRLDMSEFQEDENIKRLIGYMEGTEFVPGQLTQKVKERPFSLILLDEIEKANPQVLDLFLQILDEGHVNDGAGRRVIFSNTIIIATSNVGSQQIAKSLENGLSYHQTFKIAQIELKKSMRIEFINRFDKVIMFKPLTRVEIEKIAGIMMEALVDKLNMQGIDLKYSQNLLYELAQKGYSPVYGARELRRLIQDEVESKIAELIVSGKLKSGQLVNIESLDNILVK